MRRCPLPRTALLAAWLGLAATGAGGCGLFGGGPDAQESASGAAGSSAAAGAADGQEPGPAGAVVLNRIAQEAPAGGATQLLARLAIEFGWEGQVAENPTLREAIEDGEFETRVEPLLLTLYYRNGFSVMPVVGEGHQFNRDTVVRGALGSSRLLVANRGVVRIIFLRPVENVQIVYHQDGEPPQVFTVSEQAVVAVRQSLLKYYLR